MNVKIISSPRATDDLKMKLAFIKSCRQLITFVITPTAAKCDT